MGSWDDRPVRELEEAYEAVAAIIKRENGKS
jgi:hypothetical protein